MVLTTGTHARVRTLPRWALAVAAVCAVLAPHTPHASTSGQARPRIQAVELEHTRLGPLRVVLNRDAGRLQLLTPGAQGRAPRRLPQSVMATIESAHLYGGRTLVVLGGTGHVALREVLVFDVLASRPVDRFIAMSPVVSPDGRFLAYARFFPEHFVEGIEFQYRLYDLDRPREQNQPAVALGVTGAEPIPPPDDADDTGDELGTADIGMPLLPDLGPDGLPRENLLLDLAENPHQVLSHFVWSADSHRLAFVDSTPRDGCSLVVVRTDPAVRAERFSLAGTEAAPVTGIARCGEMMSNAFRIQFTPGGVELDIQDGAFPRGYHRAFPSN
ncbi:hypothetical protein [Ideonella sp.]|uniref:hypothetical protein n=1 Tax=Ideonella sp. TaxID=1929293 RepID=UPI0035AE7D1A